MADPYANFSSPLPNAGSPAQPTDVEPVDVAAPSLANAPMATAGGDPYAAFAQVDPTNRPGQSVGEDVLRSIGQGGLDKGVAGVIGSFGDAAKWGTSAGEWLAQQGARALGVPDSKLGGFDPHPSAPTSAAVNGLNQALTGEYHHPQTIPGHYADTISSFLPAAVGGEGALGRAAMVAVPGALSETGGQAAQSMNLGPGWEAALRTLGGLAGGGVVGGAQGVLRAPQAALGAAMPGITDAQVSAAQALRQQAAGRGLNLTLAEAVQQVTNNGTGLGRMQRVLEGTREGSATMAPYFAQRPGQVRGAVMSYADQLAPHTDQPSMIGVRAQDAAIGALDRGRQTVNSVAAPDYAALGGQTMPAEQYAAVSADPSYQRALAQLRQQPELNAPVAHLPDNSLAVINEVVKRVRQGATEAAGTPLVPGDNHLAAVRTSAAGIADEAARGVSPNYGAARDTVSDLSRQFVDPMKAGPVGAISQSADVPTQTAALYPRNPLEGAPAETAQGVRVLNNATPGVADDLTRQHLVNALNTSSRDLQTGPNQYLGSKFAVGVAGNPEQAATLRAGVCTACRRRQSRRTRPVVGGLARYR